MKIHVTQTTRPDVARRRFFAASVVVHAAVLSCLARTQWPQPELPAVTIATSIRFASPPPVRLVELPLKPPPAPARAATLRPPTKPWVTSRPTTVAKPALPLIVSVAPASLFQWSLPLPTGPAGVVSTTAANDGGEFRGVPGASTNGVAGADVVAALTTPTYAQTPLPAYPALARARGWEGTTLLRVEVQEDGSVGRVELLGSSGHTALDNSAIQAVKSWRFNPACHGDTPARCFIDVPVRFKLDKAGA